MVQVFRSGLAVAWGQLPASWAMFDVIVVGKAGGLFWAAAGFVGQVVREKWNARVVSVSEPGDAHGEHVTV